MLWCGYYRFNNLVRTNGLPDNISTYGVISGLWTSAVSLGAFVGPSIGGFLYDEFSFRPATYYVLGTQALVVSNQKYGGKRL